MRKVGNPIALKHLNDLRRFNNLLREKQSESCLKDFDFLSVAFKVFLDDPRSSYSLNEKPAYYGVLYYAYDMDVYGEFLVCLEGKFHDDPYINRVYQMLAFVASYWHGHVFDVVGINYKVAEESSLFLTHQILPDEMDMTSCNDVVNAIGAVIQVSKGYVDPLLVDFETGEIHHEVLEQVAINCRSNIGEYAINVSKLSEIMLKQTVVKDENVYFNMEGGIISDSLVAFIDRQYDLFIRKYSSLFRRWGNPDLVFASFRAYVKLNPRYMMAVIQLLNMIVRDGYDLAFQSNESFHYGTRFKLFNKIRRHFSLYILGRVVIVDHRIPYRFDQNMDQFDDVPDCIVWARYLEILADKGKHPHDYHQIKNDVYYTILHKINSALHADDCPGGTGFVLYIKVPDKKWLDDSGPMDNRYLSSPNTRHCVLVLYTAYYTDTCLSKFPREIFLKILRYFIFFHNEHKLFIGMAHEGVVGRAFILNVGNTRSAVKWYPNIREIFFDSYYNRSQWFNKPFILPSPTCGFRPSVLCICNTKEDVEQNHYRGCNFGFDRISDEVCKVGAFDPKVCLNYYGFPNIDSVGDYKAYSKGVTRDIGIDYKSGIGSKGGTSVYQCTIPYYDAYGLPETSYWIKW